MTQAQARALLKQMLGPDAEFRDDQWEAIDQIANERRRLLVVQRTGWGKSIIYFLATKILRDTTRTDFSFGSIPINTCHRAASLGS